MSEDAQVIEFSEQDKEDLAKLGIADPTLTDFGDGEGPKFHTILEVWREVLKPAAAEATKKVSPAWANRIVASFKEIRFADIPSFQERYFAKIEELLGIVHEEIATDDECLSYTTPAEDAEHNAPHYKNVLLYWQQAFLKWELEWNTADEDAAVELAAISEVHRMFFGDTGLTQYLDNIGLVFDETDQADLRESLEAFREGYGE